MNTLQNSDLLSLLMRKNGGKGLTEFFPSGMSKDKLLQGLIDPQGNKAEEEFFQVLKSEGHLQKLTEDEINLILGNKTEGEGELNTLTLEKIQKENNTSDKIDKPEKPEKPEDEVKTSKNQNLKILKDLKKSPLERKNTEVLKLDLAETKINTELPFKNKRKETITDKTHLGKTVTLKLDKFNNKKRIQNSEDFLDHKEVFERPKSDSFIAKNNIALNQYKLNHKTNNSNIISFPMNKLESEKVEVKKSEKIDKSLKQINANDTFDKLNLPAVMHNSNENSSGEMDLNTQKTEVLNLSEIQSSNKSQLLEKIGQYIEQSYIAGQDKVEVIVKHDELGQFKVSAEKSGPGLNDVRIEINTVSDKGHQFFVEHEVELVKQLNERGVKVGQVKVLPNSESLFIGESRQSFGESSQFSGGRGENQFSHQGQQGRNGNSGSERRRDLWDEAKKFREELYS